MSSSAKYIYLQRDHHMTLQDLHTYIEDYVNATKMDVQQIRMSRFAYMSFISNTHGNYTVPLEAGKKHHLHLNSICGFVPIIPTPELQGCPDGFIVLENLEFDEKFEKIILGEDEKP